MKTSLARLIGITLATTLCAHAAPVTGWVTTNGDAGFTGGSETTNSPLTTDADSDAIIGSFPSVSLVEKNESLILTGQFNVSGAGALPGGQFRIGAFESTGGAPSTGVGSGYVGAWANDPNANSFSTTSGTATHPFSGANVFETFDAGSGPALQAGTTYDFSLILTRLDGTDIEITVNVNDGAAFDWSGTTTLATYNGIDPAGSFSFDSAGFLMGGTLNRTSAQFTNIEATYVEFDSDNDGMWDAWELANGLDVGTDDSAGNPDNDGLTNIQEFLGDDGIGSTGDETNPQIADTDEDGIDDGPELALGTDPLDTDSDDDFFEDGTEVARGTNPTDALEVPYPTTDFVVDFSPNGTIAGQTGPIHDQDSFPFVAAHEVDSTADPLFGVDRSVTWPVAALGGASVTTELSYPDSTDARIKQMIGRPDAFADNYVGDDVEVMRDWVGIDARAESGGNGTAAPTTMRLTLTGLPDDTYLFRGYHHDVSSQKGRFEILVTDSTRSAANLGFFRMTHSSTDFGAHQPANPGAGNPPSTLTSTVEFVFTVSGGSATDIDFLMTETSSGDTTRSSFFALNGFEITTTTDTDLDLVPDSADLNPGADDATLNGDADSLDNLREFHLGTDPVQADSDADGWNDDVETDTDIFVSLSDTGTSPFVADWDGDGLDDGLETNDFDFSNWPTTAGTDPFVVDTDGDTYSDGEEANNGYDPTDETSLPPPPPLQARVVSVDRVGGEVTIEWNSLDNETATYDIYASDSLTGDPQSTWTLVGELIIPQGTVTSFTETQVGSGSGSETLPSPFPAKRFYIVYEFE